MISVPFREGERMSVEFNQKETEEFILELLGKGEPLTVQEIEEAASDSSMNCPDELIRFLSRMKAKGLIKGKVSAERKGWVWYIERDGNGGKE